MLLQETTQYDDTLCVLVNKNLYYKFVNFITIFLKQNIQHEFQLNTLCFVFFEFVKNTQY